MGCFRSSGDEYLNEVARSNAQLLVNKLWEVRDSFFLVHVAVWGWVAGNLLHRLGHPMAME